ncbi:MAG: hypothetical protein HAW59_03190 [Betaproteobacteria bacterium]|nr:hypothetical protein [Betaproteobacteria bacterium]
MKKLTIFSALCMGLTACGGPHPSTKLGYHIEPKQPTDYLLKCKEIEADIAELHLDVRLSGKAEPGDPTYKQKTWVRDAVARIKTLQRLGIEENCNNGGQSAQGTNANSSNTNTQQPAPQPAPQRERSRVIICDDDKTCIVD